MPGTSAASLALAARLRDRDDASLARLIRDRGVSPAGLRDVFDLAEALLDGGTVASSLAALSRRALAAIATAAQHPDGLPLSALAAAVDRDPVALLHDLVPAERAALVALGDAADGRTEPTVAADPAVLVWPSVAAELASWPARGLPSTEALRDEPAPPALEPVDDSDRRFLDRGAAEKAYTTVTRVTELLIALQESPARLLAKGGLSLPEAKRLATAADAELDEIPVLLDLAVLAGLVDDSAGHTRPLPTVDEWRGLPVADRWASLAAAWASALPEELRELLADRVDARWGEGIADFVDWLYPAGGDALLRRLHRRGAQGDRLGIATDGRPSSIGAALVTSGAAAAAEVLAPLVPPAVDKVYLQHDLTIVSPGPLAGALDERLRRVAVMEAAGLAGRYRVTQESVTRAIALGETADTLVKFLHDISLTGVPQPLEYLVRETARRYGAVRVGALDHDESTALGARTGVRSDDGVMLEAVLVDAATASLGLRRTGPHRLVSRVEPAIVLWTLIDARYPAAPDDGALPPERPRSSAARPPAPPTEDPVLAAVARLRQAAASTSNESGAAWVSRQWELAVRGKLGVRATIAMPDGTERILELEPTGIAGSRVRGRDLQADVERTLPISSITALEPLE
ncbi:MAG: helicase-associated domain-containing protein [Microcella sp.]|uniref:helicase-associated domain-containing protein n=1 Tax=Microcella sp. TaxID=1913979 RepID=UPI002722621E|nr:helicase-associated domain-containing protein [Microcella sp.]MDO8336800.1 helicase-associated domain-containing protein [Microcella sp.]